MDQTDTPYTWSPAEREIFRYNDGRQIVSRDPGELRRILYLAFAAKGIVIDQLFADIRNAEKVATRRRPKEVSPEEAAAADEALRLGCQAHLRLADVVREVFQLAPFEQGGPDIDRVLGLHDAFVRYLEKKNPPDAEPSTSGAASESISATSAVTSTSSVSN